MYEHNMMMQDEAKFWKNINLDEYFSQEDFSAVTFPNLKPTSRSISIRLPEFLLNRIKDRANKMQVPYQSLIKTSLQDIFAAS